MKSKKGFINYAFINNTFMYNVFMFHPSRLLIHKYSSPHSNSTSKDLFTLHLKRSVYFTFRTKRIFSILFSRNIETYILTYHAIELRFVLLEEARFPSILCKIFIAHNYLFFKKANNNVKKQRKIKTAYNN